MCLLGRQYFQGNRYCQGSLDHNSSSGKVECCQLSPLPVGEPVRDSWIIWRLKLEGHWKMAKVIKSMGWSVSFPGINLLDEKTFDFFFIE